jgi:WD40 repeat protein
MSTAPVRTPVWIQPSQDPVTSLAWSPDGTQLSVLGTEGTLVSRNPVSGDILTTHTGHHHGGFECAWHPTEAILASSGQDGWVRFWSPGSSEPSGGFEAGAAWVEHLSWSPAGKHLAASAGKKLLIWSPSENRILHTLSDHKSTLSAIEWRRDGKAVAVSCYGMVRFYLPDSGAVAETLPWKTSLISLALSPDNRWIAAGTQEQSVQIWELPFRPGDELAMSGYEAKVRELAWHPSGRYLATGGSSQVMVWDCSGAGPAGTSPTLLEAHEERISALQYQSKGHLLASAGSDSRVLLWNVRKSVNPLVEFRAPAPVTHLAWSRDDLWLAFGCRDGSVGVVKAPPN